MVAMHDQITLRPSALVWMALLGDLDAAEMRAVIAAQEFVVIAGHVDDARSLAALAQELLHHVVMGLRPVPAGFQRPAIDDIADQVDRVGVVMAEEVDELVGLASARAEMHVRHEQGAIMAHRRIGHQQAVHSAISHTNRRFMRIDVPAAYCRLMTMGFTIFLTSCHRAVIAFGYLCRNEPCHCRRINLSRPHQRRAFRQHRGRDACAAAPAGRLPCAAAACARR